MEDPAGFRTSRSIGSWLELTKRRYGSSQTATSQGEVIIRYAVHCTRRRLSSTRSSAESTLRDLGPQAPAADRLQTSRCGHCAQASRYPAHCAEIRRTVRQLEPRRTHVAGERLPAVPSLPGRGPEPFRLMECAGSSPSARSKGRFPPAKTQHAAADADREDDPEPGTRLAQFLLAFGRAV